MKTIHFISPILVKSWTDYGPLEYPLGVDVHGFSQLEKFMYWKCPAYHGITDFFYLDALDYRIDLLIVLLSTRTLWRKSLDPVMDCALCNPSCIMKQFIIYLGPINHCCWKLCVSRVLAKYKFLSRSICWKGRYSSWSIDHFNLSYRQNIIAKTGKPHGHWPRHQSFCRLHTVYSVCSHDLFFWNGKHFLGSWISFE